MIKIRSRLTHHTRGPQFVIHNRLLNRILNGTLFLLLAISAVVSLASGSGFSSAGIFIFLVLFIFTGYGAAANTSYRFDPETRQGECRKTLFGLTRYLVTFTFDDIRHVQLQVLEYEIHSKRRSNPALYKLNLAFNLEENSTLPPNMLLEDSSNAEELLEVGKVLSAVINRPFETDYHPGR